ICSWFNCIVFMYSPIHGIYQSIRISFCFILLCFIPLVKKIDECFASLHLFLLSKIIFLDLIDFLDRKPLLFYAYSEGSRHPSFVLNKIFSRFQFHVLQKEVLLIL